MPSQPVQLYQCEVKTVVGRESVAGECMDDGWVWGGVGMKG